MDFVSRARTLLSNRNRRILEPGPVPAAVLLPLFKRDNEHHLLFTKRAQHLVHHSGEISFPGGVLEPEEEPEHGALREAWEELGISPSDVEIIGLLDDVYSVHHFLVTPIVGMIPGDIAYTVNTDEIERILEVPVSHLLDPSVVRIQPHEWQGQSFLVHHYDFFGDDIWGMTASILAQFLEIVFHAEQE